MKKLTLALMAGCMSLAVSSTYAATGSPADTDAAGRYGPGTAAGQMGAADPTPGKAGPSTRSGTAAGTTTGTTGGSGMGTGATTTGAATGSGSGTTTTTTAGTTGTGASVTTTDTTRPARTRRAARASRG